jgi:trk system potassium uptake protein TrkA
MKVLIVGAGKTGEFLAEKLAAENDVTVIEQRHARAAEVRGLVPDAIVLEGDACEPEVLEAASVGDFDIAVAATGDDEDNLVVAMLAKYYKVPKVYARVNHPRNEWLFDEAWGVDVAVSGPSVLQSLIDKDMGPGDLIRLLRLQADGVSIEELTLPEDASSVGRTLADVLLPSNVTVMAILAADGYVQAPRGNTPLVAGDQLLLLVEGSLGEEDIRSVFGIKREEQSSAEQPGSDH